MTGKEADKIPTTTINRIKTIAWLIVPFLYGCYLKSGQTFIYEQNVYISYNYGKFLKNIEKNETVPAIVIHIHFPGI